MKNRNRILITFAVLVLLAGALMTTPAISAASVRYVAPGGACGAATPCYSSIQAAVNAAAVGDEIRIAAGTYTGVNSSGGHAQHVYITKSLTIKGGYTTSNWTTPNPGANTTELQAQTLGRVVYITGVTTSVTLRGLHLTYGDSNGLGGSTSGNDAGGGVYAYQSNISINQCWLTGNASPSDGYGGGSYIRDGILNIANTIMQDNEAGHGGAAYLSSTKVQIGSNSEFRENRTTATNGEGAAIAVSGGTFTLSDSTIADNTASVGAPYAGALNISGSQFSIDNVEVSGTVKSNGVFLGGTGTLQDSTIQNNGYSGIKIGDGTIAVNGSEIAYNGTDITYAGAGVQISGILDMTVTLDNNDVHHNQSNGGGGGVSIDTAPDGWITLTDNIIQENTAGKLPLKYGAGGGVTTSGDNVTLERNLIQNNTAIGILAGYQWGGVGGGVYINNNPTLINNVITGNAAVFGGSGIYIRGGAPNLYHTTIANNSAGSSNDETGVYAAEKSSTEKAQPKLWNTIITNQATGIYAKGDVVANIVFIDGILWYGNSNNTAGTGTFFLSHTHTGDPLFINPASDNYHIGSGSAAINVGLNGKIPAGVTTDLDGKPRIANGVVDLGADEFDGFYRLKVIKAGNGLGKVTSSPAGIDCGADCAQSFNKNTVVTLTATAETGSIFGGWSGHADCTDGKVTMYADKTCTATFNSPITKTFRSQAAYDGWVLESSGTSNQGGTMNAAATTIYLGDDAQDRQYRSILSFDTSSLPDNATITSIVLKIKKQGLVGADPFSTHQNILVDIRKGAFSIKNALQLIDFQAVASKSSAGTIQNTPGSGWYSSDLGSGVFIYINLTGITQFRLRFKIDDNDDQDADYLKFYSGNQATISLRPLLVMKYYVP